MALEPQNASCQLIKDFFAGTLHAYGRSFSLKQRHFGSLEKAHPFLSACYAKTKDNRDAQLLPIKMLELLLHTPTIRFQL